MAAKMWIEVIAMMKTIYSGECYAPHPDNRTMLYDRNGVRGTNVPVRHPGPVRRPVQDEEVYFIQVEGVRRPTGLFIACDPFTLPERVRTKINRYAEVFLHRLRRL
jgi:hypothetical protein